MTEYNSRALQTVTVLCVSPNREISRSLQGIFGHTNWTLFCTESFEGAEVTLREEVIAVVITEASLPGQKRWRDFIETPTTSCPPRIIVAAHSQDDPLWAEVLSEGGYDLLMKPFDRSEVVRVVGLAWLNWRDQQAETKPGRLSPFYQSGGSRSPVRIPIEDSSSQAA